MEYSPPIGLVGLRGSDRRLRIVLQEELSPFPEEQWLALTNNLKNSLVPRLQALSQALLRLLPVFGVGRFTDNVAGAIAILDP